MKRKKILIILAAVLVVIIALTLILQNTVGKTNDTESDETSVYTVAEIESDDISSISWNYSGEDLKLEKSSGEWTYPEDSEFPLQQSVAQAMADSVSAVTASVEISDPSDLSEYGLDEPKMTITVATADGKETSFSIGSENTLASGWYILKDGDKSKVWLTDSTLGDAFSYGLNDLAEKEEIPGMSQVLSIRDVTKSSDLNISYLEDNDGVAYTNEYHWFAEQDGSLVPVDTEKVTTLTGYMTGLSWVSLIDYKADTLAEYGLENPAAKITLTYTPQSTGSDADSADASSAAAVFKLNIGDSLADGGYYACIDGSKMVYRIDDATAQGLLYANYTSVRPDDVCLMDWDTVSGMDVTIGSSSYSISFDGTKQVEYETSTTTDDGNTTTETKTMDVRVFSRDGKTLDSESVETLLSAINGLTAADEASVSDNYAAEVTINFHRNTDTFKEMTLTLYSYSNDYCLVGFNGETRLLVARSDVQSLISAANAITEEKADSADGTSAAQSSAAAS